MSLVADGISVTDRSGRTVVPVLSFTLEPRTVTVVVAQSGPGAGALVRVLAGLERPSTGTVLLDGAPPAAADPRIAVVPGGHGLATSLTATENVVIPLLARGVPAAEAAERARTCLADVGLGEAGTHLTEELSGGQQQRVAVARALATQADVILGDGPTSALDATNAGRVMTLLRQAARAGAAVLLTTDDETLAEDADAVLSLDDHAQG